MDELRVPKRKVPAEVILLDGRVRRISLFLAEAAPGHAGPERPADLLNGGGEFVPAFDEDAQAMTFLNRSALELVRVDPALEPDDAEVAGPTEHRVEVLLGSGATVTGTVSYVRPAENARLQDFLNEPAPFFRLAEERAVALVNRRRVARVAIARP